MNRYFTCLQYAALCGALSLFSGACATAGRQQSDMAAYGGGSQPGSGYTFGPDDVIQVRVEGHPEWTGEFTVHPDGTIRMETLGNIPVQGLDEQQLQGRLAEQMGAYIRNPQVSVATSKYISQVISVLGDVNRPGEYSTAGKRITLKDAIVLAGLPGRYAVEERVYIITPSRSRPRQRVVNLYRVLYRGELENNIVLQPGDIVYVPKSILGRVADFFSSIFNPITSNSAGAVMIP